MSLHHNKQPFARLIVFFIFLMSGSCFAQGPYQSALYKIEGNGLSTPSYLFGTVNFLPQFGYFVPDEVKAAISSSDVFVTKIPMKWKVRKKFNEAAKIPLDGRVDKYLTVGEQEKLRRIVEEYGGKNAAYDNFYSKLQPAILVPATTALTLKYNIVYPRQELEDLAKANKAKFKSLSSVNEEIEALKQFPILEQIEALKDAINNFDEQISSYNSMVRSYMKEQDMDAVREETFKAFNNNAKFIEAYYDARSKIWLPEIIKLIESKPTFIALGVPHIIGNSGLVNLLKASGYTVTPVVLDFAPAKTSN